MIIRLMFHETIQMMKASDLLLSTSSSAGKVLFLIHVIV